MHLSNVFEIGFFMGLLGSVHCIGMCGPLVMALPLTPKNIFQKTIAIVLYHLGKILSYASLGVLFGLFGSQLPIFGFQQHISIVIGVAMLLYLVYVFIFKAKHFYIPGFSPIHKAVINALGNLFKKDSAFAFLAIGILNGLLPCGMIYFALSSAMATQNIIQGGWFMAFFGLGTVPVLLMVTIWGQFMGFAFRRKLQRLIPVFIFGVGVLLILRGLNLGISYISPVLGIGNEVISCHN